MSEPTDSKSATLAEQPLTSSTTSSTDYDATVQRALLNDAERVAQMGSYVWDVATNTVVWSDNFYRIAGFDPQATAPSIDLFVSRVHPDDVPLLNTTMSNATDEGGGDPIEYRLNTPLGERIIQARGMGVHDDDGQLVRIIGTIQDVTLHRARAVALEVHAHILEEAQTVANLGSWTWRPSTGVIKWSPELYRITGLPSDHLPSVESFDALVHPDDREAHQAERIAAIESGVIKDSEVRIVRPDGVIRRVLIHARAFDDPDQWFMGIVQDVTDQRDLEERVRRSQTMEAIGRLATGVAHDFNNLLTVIALNARMLEATRPAPELDDIVSAAGTAAELTQRLLSLGRASQTPLVALDIDAAIRKAETLLSRAAGDNLALELETKSGVVVRADARQLDQALLNLVINARDATPAAGRIAIRTHPAPEGGCFIDVIDNGIGMSDEVLNKALDPFFTTKDRGMGTGLGLSMVHGAVTNMNGTVSLHPVETGGLRVRLWLPAAERDYVARERALADTPTLAAGTRILVVDDEDAVRNVTATMLRRQGMAVETADGPIEAEQFARRDLDLVLCDVSMPDGGGVAVLDAFTLAGSTVPFVFMTGYGDGDERLEGYTVIGKPFFPAELTAELAGALARSDGEQQSPPTSTEPPHAL